MTRPTSETLRSTLERSPARLLPGSFWYSQMPSGSAAPKAVLALIDDGVEVTLIAETRIDHVSRGPFSLIRLEVAVPFESPGFLASIAGALASAEMSVLIVSTFSFDYLLVKEGSREEVLDLLTELGMPVHR